MEIGSEVFFNYQPGFKEVEGSIDRMRIHVPRKSLSEVSEVGHLVESLGMLDAVHNWAKVNEDLRAYENASFTFERESFDIGNGTHYFLKDTEFGANGPFTYLMERVWKPGSSEVREEVEVRDSVYALEVGK